jgi:hypothetical protein
MMFQVSTRDAGSYAGMERREWIVRRPDDPPEAYEVFGTVDHAELRAAHLNGYLREEIPIAWLPQSAVYWPEGISHFRDEPSVIRVTALGERVAIRERAERRVAPLIGKLFTLGRGNHYTTEDE